MNEAHNCVSSFPHVKNLIDQVIYLPQNAFAADTKDSTLPFIRILGPVQGDWKCSEPAGKNQ